MKKKLTVFFLLAAFSCICFIFWYSEWRYSLPTPVPKQYQVVKTNEYVDLGNRFIPENNGPVFLHFFNPDCPCSRFNIPHFKSLVNKYADKINFVVVVITANKNYTATLIKKKYELTVPVLFDSSLASTCGVYSTPQAVLLDNDHTLYYRGNYNKTRYCTDQKTGYAQIAINSLLAKKQDPVFSNYAITAYGCSLPACKE